MKYVAESLAWQEKDWRDQPLHFLAGYGAIVLLMWKNPVWWVAIAAFCIVMALAAWREWDQHKDTRVIFDLDLLVTFFGVVFAIFVMLN